MLKKILLTLIISLGLATGAQAVDKKIDYTGNATLSGDTTLMPDSEDKKSYSGFGKFFGKKVMIINLDANYEELKNFIDKEWAVTFVCSHGKKFYEMFKRFDMSMVIIFNDKIITYSNFECKYNENI